MSWNLGAKTAFIFAAINLLGWMSSSRPRSRLAMNSSMTYILNDSSLVHKEGGFAPPPSSLRTRRYPKGRPLSD
ncbi:hypothetical protein P8C59_003861 [Phyllachora maydis]|uniref:Uncharacterized protein n=1 Tax=Phyllachora maydis TaxID=1825666 RepID=A0AAD9I2K3_9PEZI|nr:hypothetical protein P8C59_003861 [Phyllachora maydis]